MLKIQYVQWHQIKGSPDLFYFISINSNHRRIWHNGWFQTFNCGRTALCIRKWFGKTLKTLKASHTQLILEWVFIFFPESIIYPFANFRENLSGKRKTMQCSFQVTIIVTSCTLWKKQNGNDCLNVATLTHNNVLVLFIITLAMFVCDMCSFCIIVQLLLVPVKKRRQFMVWM